MKGLLIAVVLLLAALAQVAVAPLFPLGSTSADFALIALLLVAIYGGPFAAMAGLPPLVLFLGFSSDVEFEWLLLSYLPILPVAYWLETRSTVPLSPYAQTLLTGVLVGAWARALLAAVAMTAGAHVAIGTLITAIVLPGMLLDASFLTLAYFAGRLVGWRVRPMTLQRAGF